MVLDPQNLQLTLKKGKPMTIGKIDATTLATLMGTVRQVFPEALVDQENSGQIIIYTGLLCVGDPETPLVPLPDDD